MLRLLQFQDFVIIPSAALELRGGMTAITGETGAGKSLLLDGLNLLAGTRAQPSLVRRSAERATVEALFEVNPGHPALALLREAGIDLSAESGEIMLRREVASTGRSRAFVNGRLCPATQLESIAETLFEVCTQHEQHRLLRPEAQRELFDRFAGVETLRRAVSAAYDQYRAAREQLDNLREEAKQDNDRADFLRFQLEELSAADIQPGEEENLRAEFRRLSDLTRLQEESLRALACLDEPPPGEPSALELLGRSLASVDYLAEAEPSLRSDAEGLREAYDKVREAARQLNRFLGSLQSNPERLNEVGQRLELIRKILRKYGPTEELTIARRESLQAEVDAMGNRENDIADAELAAEQARAALGKLTTKLRQERERAAKKFCRQLEPVLRDLALPKARVEVALQPFANGIEIDDCLYANRFGTESPRLLFSANSGDAPRPIEECASGGEQGRLLLALRTLAGGGDNAPTLIFDEIDAGISGAAARTVAERLYSAARATQILCVTHNACVAAAADAQFFVEKTHGSESTATTVRELTGDERAVELARLLDGGAISASGLHLAEELLRKAG